MADEDPDNPIKGRFMVDAEEVLFDFSDFEENEDNQDSDLHLSDLSDN